MCSPQELWFLSPLSMAPVQIDERKAIRPRSRCPPLVLQTCCSALNVIRPSDSLIRCITMILALEAEPFHRSCRCFASCL